MYKLVRASDDDPVIGGFYGEEISAVSPGDVYAIDKVIKLDKRGGRAFVSWKGYGPEFNSYVSLDDIQSYQDHLDGTTPIDDNDDDDDDNDSRGGSVVDTGVNDVRTVATTGQRASDNPDDQSVPTQ